MRRCAPRGLPSLLRCACVCLLLAVPVLVDPRGVRGEDDEALAEALEEALQMERELIRTCERVRPLTVTVWNCRYPKRNGKVVEGEPARPVGGGSGVLVERRKKIWVITNVHVIQGADVVKVVTFDGKTRRMNVHDQIRQYDIALLSFPKKPRDLKGYTLNPSKIKASRVLEEGAWVLATGNPFHLAGDGQPVATVGVVSGKDRILGRGFVYGNAIQHDAEVNPGNSGGPLWNRKGELVGINGMISIRPGAGARANTGASFSIPIHQVNSFLTAMIEQSSTATAGYLGLQVETAMDDGGNPRGARVVKAAPDSPAGPTVRKGLKPGDIITVIWGFGEDHRINTASDITNLLSMCRAGTFLKIKYKRGKRFYEWSGKLTAGGGRRR